MKLYGYFRSSAVYRVRIALGLKGLGFDPAYIHLRKGDQFSDAFKAVNPQQLIPALETSDGDVLIQSLAMIEWLDETHPQPPLLPADPIGRARARAMANVVACDIHPLCNVRVGRYLKEELGHDDADVETWSQHWIGPAFEALEALTLEAPGAYAFGDSPTLADICLIPQMANARRVNLDMAPYPNLLRIEESCSRLDAFENARPENQPDAE